jgi:hypothetical protein
MKKKPNSRGGISGKVARRILVRAAAGDPFVVVPRHGVPSRCFGLAEYEKMQLQPPKHKPWEKRKSRQSEAPDPLGAVKGTLHSSLGRRDIYE